MTARTGIDYIAIMQAAESMMREISDEKSDVDVEKAFGDQNLTVLCGSLAELSNTITSTSSFWSDPGTNFKGLLAMMLYIVIAEVDKQIKALSLEPAPTVPSLPQMDNKAVECILENVGDTNEDNWTYLYRNFLGEQVKTLLRTSPETINVAGTIASYSVRHFVTGKILDGDSRQVSLGLEDFESMAKEAAVLMATMINAAIEEDRLDIFKQAVD